MGQIVTLKCQKCGYEENLFVGTGITFNNLESVISLFDEETQVRIRESVSNNPKSLWYICKEIGICDVCKKISAVGVFTMNGSGGEKIQYQGKCQCGKKVNLADTEKVIGGKIKLECPQCGDLLFAKLDGNWD